MGRNMILADTTVVIDIARGKYSIQEYFNQNQNKIYAISAITITEIYIGVYYTYYNQTKTRFLEEKAKYEKVLNDFEIISISNLILHNSGRIIANSQFNGTPICLADAIIEATAQEINAEKILSRNKSHFESFEIPVETYIILDKK